MFAFDSSGAVSPLGALLVGLVAGAVCPLAISLKYKFGYDDALDVVGVHLVGGIIGTLMVGLVGTAAAPSGRDGLFYGGGLGLLGVQAVAAGAVLVYSFVVTLVLAKLVDLVIGFRLPADQEREGADVSIHAETAYDLDGVPHDSGHAKPAEVVASAERLAHESEQVKS